MLLTQVIDILVKGHERSNIKKGCNLRSEDPIDLPFDALKLACQPLSIDLYTRMEMSKVNFFPKVPSFGRKTDLKIRINQTLVYDKY